MKWIHIVLLSASALLLSGCNVLSELKTIDPESASSACEIAFRGDDARSPDLLACDCMEIGGRDPKCWGYTEYRGRPMPLAAPLDAQALRPEAAPVSQAGMPEIPVNGIVNAASFMNRILAAGAIARGSIFTIFGSDLGPSIGVAVTAFPLATELAGVRVRVFTLEGEVEAIPLFVSAGQINAIMPSDAPLGYVAVEVTFEGQTGNVAPVQVVDAAVGIFTATGTGEGPASVTNFVSQIEQPLNTTASPTSPGEFVTLWVTGLGGVEGSDTMRPIDIGAVVDVRDQVDIEIFVGSRLVTNTFYAGRSAEFSGLDQIVFQIPADVELGCYTPIHIRTNGRPSNGASLAVASDGSACKSITNPLALPDDSLSRAGLHADVATLDSGPSRRNAGFIGTYAALNLFRISGSSRGAIDDPFLSFVAEQGSAVFAANPPAPSGFSLLVNLPPVGTCLSARGIVSVGPDDEIETNLDAGTEITVTRADGEMRAINLADGGVLGSGLPGDEETLPLFLDPGTYGVASDGGADVGAFSLDVEVPGQIVWTSRGEVDPITRSGFEVRWEGVSSNRTVALVGTSSNGIDRVAAAFACTANAADGSLWVPDYALANLPNGRVPEDGLLLLMSFDELATHNTADIDAGSVWLSAFDYVPALYRD